MEIFYFEEAIDFLLDHPQIETKKGIGVCGISKGASIALAMAATISGSKLGAVAAINGPIYSTMVSMNYKGKLLCEAKGKYIYYSVFMLLQNHEFIPSIVFHKWYRNLSENLLTVVK